MCVICIYELAKSEIDMMACCFDGCVYSFVRDAIIVMRGNLCSCYSVRRTFLADVLLFFWHRDYGFIERTKEKLNNFDRYDLVFLYACIEDRKKELDEERLKELLSYPFAESPSLASLSVRPQFRDRIELAWVQTQIKKELIEVRYAGDKNRLISFLETKDLFEMHYDNDRNLLIKEIKKDLDKENLTSKKSAV